MPYLLSFITRGVVVIACFLTVTQSSSGGIFDGDPSCPQKCKCSAHFKTISCEHQGLEEIPRGIPQSATVLYLGYNLLDEIKANSFQQLVNLTELSLRNNKIHKIENGAFNGLKKLKSLTFRNNALRTIDSPLAFQDLDSLQNLYFTSNNLTSVPDLRHVPNLIYLTLDNNNLQTAQLCRNNSNFKNLSTIIFSNNPRLDRIDADDFTCVKRDKVRKINLIFLDVIWTRLRQACSSFLIYNLLCCPTTRNSNRICWGAFFQMLRRAIYLFWICAGLWTTQSYWPMKHSRVLKPFHCLISNSAIPAMSKRSIMEPFNI